MPEQAQRRAPEGHPLETPKNDNNALEELRHLIVAPEQEGIQEIRERLDDMERRAEDVSSVVAEAIQMRRDQGDDTALAEALAPTIEATLRDSVRKDPHVLADALFPVMGPAIRKSITETLRSMLESFNEALEHSLSLQGLKWRVEALRTGKPFAEIVLMHSLLYRVEQVFLIHRETGLVLHHVVAPSVATQDPAMVAGMLSAIQQFVRDSFSAERTESLDSMEVGELKVWIEEGPYAVLANVIRGHAPAGYRTAMKEALEAIEQKFGGELQKFEGDTGPFAATENLLAPLLEAQFKQETGPKKKPWALITATAAVAILLAGWIGYSTYLLIEWSRFLKALHQQPGIVVISYEKSGGQFHLRGFRDPLAEDPSKFLAQAGLSPEQVNFEMAPYYSVDDAIVLRRAKELLHPPAGVTLREKGGVLEADGVAPPQWIASLREKAPWIAGVGSVDASHLQNADLVEFNRLKGAMETTMLLFLFGRAQLEAGQEKNLGQATQTGRDLVAQASKLNGKIVVEIVGHTDITGVEGTNLSLSKQRADRIQIVLMQSGIKPANLHSRGVGTSEPLANEDTEEGRQRNRSVTFKVAFSPTSPVD
jgi:outer membrane protein OmpA-like peptidoglycan-associated protein